MLRDKFASEVSDFLNGINALNNFLMHDVIKHGFWITLDVDQLLYFLKWKCAVLFHFHYLVVGDGNLMAELLAEVRLVKQAADGADDYLVLVFALTQEEVAWVFNENNVFRLV